MFGDKQQPERAPMDGAVDVRLVGTHIEITCVQNGAPTTVRMSEFNAWRAFGMLALMLGVKLPSSVAKSIKL